MNRKGMTLLEAIVALVILGLVVLSYLELFAGTVRSSDQAQTWSQAVVYAEDAMEEAKLRGAGPRVVPAERLGGGFERRVEVNPYQPGLTRVTVVVSLPQGGRFELERLVSRP
jgi:prepilin-type N-terminal cleavage/methylation domain-containing protein